MPHPSGVHQPSFLSPPPMGVGVMAMPGQGYFPPAMFQQGNFIPPPPPMMGGPRGLPPPPMHMMGGRGPPPMVHSLLFLSRLIFHSHSLTNPYTTLSYIPQFKHQSHTTPLPTLSLSLISPTFTHNHLTDDAPPSLRRSNDDAPSSRISTTTRYCPPFPLHSQ